MADTIKSLRLPGLNEISEEERQRFMLANDDKLRKYRSPGKKRQAAEVLYNNQLFKSTFGEDAFQKAKEAGYDYSTRNQLLKEKLVDDAFKEAYSPFDEKGKRSDKKGLGKNWEQYNSDLSTDAKLELLKSDWKTPEQMEKYNKEDTWYGEAADYISDKGGIVGKVLGFLPKAVNDTYKEARNQYRTEANQKILDRVWNNNADSAATQHGKEISQAYMMPEITGTSDDDTRRKFTAAITPSKTNMGIPEYASHWGDGSDPSSEMEDFTIDEMRQVLAKKTVYDATMSPQMAATALNNEAKRYIKAHQGDLKRFGLFAKDVGISALSYTADKVNGVMNLARMAQDELDDLPTVFVNDKGEVVDPSKQRIVRDNKGNLFYDDSEGRHSVHQQQISRTTLHNMGRNYDGTEDTSIFNPTYWTKAEQFGTLDEAKQKQYEKLGSSPYKVVYDPNDDRDLWYESFKMMSFGIADAASMFIPFGIGVAGRAISTADKAGKLIRGLGKGMDYAGRALSTTRAAQVGQGLAGAAGIAYAYERGAFQETLAQNLANAEEAAMNRSKQEVFNQYNTDEQYKSQVDALVKAKALEMKQAYMAQAQREGNKVVDEKAVDNLVLAKADEAVKAELVQQKYNEFKGSDEFAALQNEAIRSAGETANTVFLPEAIKYGLVNTIGFRKFWYSNPSSLAKGASKTFKGLKEATTDAGKQRMVAEGSKFNTVGQKMKQLGKVAGSQFWGGAWTNGTDDMMVDAAQRINNDSYDRYLRSYESGEGIADSYGFADGLYSYWKGLSNSLGQQTTWEAAAVGGFGSLVSASPNMANIAHLATKEGRDAYKNAFNDRVVRNEDGSIRTDEQGNPVTENAGFGERLNYFIQNGVLNNYYAKRQNERDLRAHADYVNKLLDDYEDFRVIGDIITSDMGIDDAETEGDKKTMRFVKAINTLNALNHLGNNTQDPAAMSSVIGHIKDMIDKVNNNELTEEDVQSEISQYYASHPELEQNETNNQMALEHITRNAKKLAEATKAYEDAEKQVRKAEKALGRSIAPDVRDKMRMQQALDKHWGERRDEMRKEIGDTSDVNGELSVDSVIPSYGNKTSAQAVVKLYDTQEAEYEEHLIEQHKETQRLEEEYKKAQKTYQEATASEDKYVAQVELVKAQSEWENAQQEELFTNDMLAKTRANKKKIKDALEATKEDKGIRVLSSSEIFNLDSTSRARMLNPVMRGLYSEAQQAEITKLENELRMKDADSLQKIQDIAKLTNYINQNQDAYNRIMKNPEAAEVQLEKQRKSSAEAAQELINKRNSAILASFTEQMDNALKFREDVSAEERENLAYLTLRRFDSKLLNNIKEENLLPDYGKQLDDAIEWRGVVEDVDSVIDNLDVPSAQKASLKQSLDAIVDKTNSKEDILKELEKVIDDVDNPQVVQDFEKILNGLEQLGYQRDATIVESRKQRKEREEAEAQRKKKAEEGAKIAAAEAQAKAQEAANAQQAQEVKPDGSNLQGPWDVAPIDQGEETAVQQGELSEPIDLSGEGPSLGWQVNPDVKITREIANKDFGERYTDAATDENVDSYEQPKLKATADYLNGKINDRDYLAAMGMATGEHSWLDSPQTSKEDIAKDAQKRAEARKKYLKSNKKESPAVSNNVEEQLIIDNGDSVQGKSATIDEQMSETNEGKEVHSSEETTDVAAQNGAGEHVIETSATSLSGNAMAEWKPGPLKSEGKLEHKQGTRPDDSMSKYYAWMDAAGIKLQNIIDQELGLILKQNPHAKVKFMAIRPENNVTHDGDMKTHLMLVLDYDNKINKGITNIHNDENGGVLESNGKKYLVIGTVGYGNRNADKLALYDILFSNNPKSTNGYGLVKRGQGEFFRAHPDDRFYVPENLSTEVVPMSLIPGYIVKQLESDSNPEFRSIRELVADPARNPQGIEMKDLAFGIQELTKFLVVGANLNDVMVPRNTERNSGSAFVLIPAGNGKMVPSYLKPLFYNEMRDGQLRDRVNELWNNVTAPNYATRLQAVEDLSRIFHFDKEGDTILLMKSKNVVSLVHDGKPFKTFTLDENFDRQAFMEAVSEMNPRINITKSVLQSNVLLQQYDEAGALMTDIALLNTAGSSYSIYGVDANGNMIQPEEANNDIPNVNRNSDFRNGDRSQVVFKHQYYNYDVNEGRYYLKGVPVQDETLIRDLDYNRRIIENGISPVETSGVWSTYILGSKEHPEAIKVNRNTKEVKEIPDSEAIQIMERLEKEAADKERAEAVKKALETNKVEDVPILSDEEGLVVDDETGELVTPDELRQRQSERNTQLGEKEKKGGEEEVTAVQPSNQTDKLHKSGTELNSSVTSATENFTNLTKSKVFKPFMRRFRSIIQQKWPAAPSKVAELEKFLRDKNVEVDAIGTSETDIGVWLDTIENCR